MARIELKKRPETEKQIRAILNKNIEKWFFSRFSEFSLPQLYGVMEIHKRNNVLISAPTGATKTLTAFLSILNELVDSAEKNILEDKIYCIYVSPLKALNEDIKVNLVEPLKEIEKIYGKGTGIRIATRTGDTSQNEKAKMLKNPPHILITTPESLAILLSSIKFRENMKSVQWLIVDEIHSLAENKRGVHLSLSMEHLEMINGHITRVGLSATVAPIKEIAKYLVGFDQKRNCKIVDVQFIKELDLKVLSPVKDLIRSSYEEKHIAMYRLMHKLIQRHKTTLIFTNTRSATERVISYLKEFFPKYYKDNIGAHHSSLSKELRHEIEERLRKGKIKAVVSSTSLELGIDIGYIDLVILLGSPKSVARALQRVGRSGHKLKSKTKGRLIVLDRDDLVECSVLLKCAIEKKIDKVHIPINSLDVLAQQIYGFVIAEPIKAERLFSIIKKSYCYHNLSKNDFMSVVKYLSGEYSSLQDRHVYAKIAYNKETGMLYRRGKMARVIYMTNIGTIPDESFVKVKSKTRTIGKIDEAFLERLHKGDVFVLGGEKYMFLYSKGMTAFVSESVQRPPTIPSWVSEMLPLSFDLAMEIQHFRMLVEEKLRAKIKKKDIIKFIDSYLYLDKNAAEAIYNYFSEQFLFMEIPNEKKIVVEHYRENSINYYIFHALFGRRVNDAFSRAMAFLASRQVKADISINVNDNGFFISSEKPINIRLAFDALLASEVRSVVEKAIEKTEILKRRFRHCAGRSLMILRNYMGKRKRVGRQQISSSILINTAREISNDFPILKEARREVMEDLMDIENLEIVVDRIRKGKIKIKEYSSEIPSPFAFNIVLLSHADILKIEDKTEFLKKMHSYVMAKIALKHNKAKKNKAVFDEFSYAKLWDDMEKKKAEKEEYEKEKLKIMLWSIKDIEFSLKQKIADAIDEGMADEEIKKEAEKIRKKLPKRLAEFIFSQK